MVPEHRVTVVVAEADLLVEHLAAGVPRTSFSPVLAAEAGRCERSSLAGRDAGETSARRPVSRSPVARLLPRGVFPSSVDLTTSIPREPFSLAECETPPARARAHARTDDQSRISEVLRGYTESDVFKLHRRVARRARRPSSMRWCGRGNGSLALGRPRLRRDGGAALSEHHHHGTRRDLDRVETLLKPAEQVTTSIESASVSRNSTSRASCGLRYRRTRI